jgi:precorrin isomerase
MIKAGINEARINKYGCKVFSYIDDEQSLQILMMNRLRALLLQFV